MAIRCARSMTPARPPGTRSLPQCRTARSSIARPGPASSRRAFGHRCHYTLAERDGAIAGVLPLAHVKTRLFGNTLISTPFCVYGGPLAAERESAATRWRPTRKSLLRKLGATAVEFRERQAVEAGDWLVAAGPLRHIPQADRRRRRHAT